MANHEFKWKHFAPEIILWCLRWYGSTPMHKLGNTAKIMSLIKMTRKLTLMELNLKL